ncbi:hypothetical protein A3F06_03325 [candidate division TM6 bacterium RIFCSPHIGHO2_12_FULL_36_22]|nr:MAG: hypothetical protein A3F06_03325 [candidate division TM6 bacterium RIFCSPHIGHO2_12_FULL_36_22]
MNGNSTFVEGLAKILAKMKVISTDEMEGLIHDFKVSPKARFDYFLLEEGIVEKDDLLRALSEYYQIPYFDIEGYFFNRDLLILFPKDLLERDVFIPIELDESIMTIVVSDPELENLRDDIGDYTTYVIEFRVGLRRDIISAIREFYDKNVRELEEEEADKESGAPDDDDDIVDFIS